MHIWLLPLSSTYGRNGIVVGVFALQSVNLGFISQVESHQNSLKNGIHRLSLLGAQHKRGGVRNKSASLLVVSLGKALNGMPSSLCGKGVVGPSSLPIVVAPSN